MYAARRRTRRSKNQSKKVGANCFWVVVSKNGAVLAAYTEKEMAVKKASEIDGARVEYRCQFFIDEENLV